jgi:hypothetical protein
VLGLFVGCDVLAYAMRTSVWARAVVWAYGSIVRSCFRVGLDVGDVVEQIDFRQLSNEIMAFQPENGVSGMCKRMGNAVYDVIQEE